MPAEPLEAEAPAKVNLGLRVKSADRSGLHPIVSLVQAIDRMDTLVCEEAESDVLEVDGADLPEGGGNLVWRAAEAVRSATGDRRRLSFRLTKRIPVAAGLGGGSADGAAVLVILERLLRLERHVLAELAAGLGADVPFGLHGGFAWMEGHGEKLTRIDGVPTDFALGVVVPPHELATEAVYTTWDRLGCPAEKGVSGRALPPSLRSFGALGNDLFPAAALLQPEVAAWRSELETVWDRPVLLSGSGPALFAFFSDSDEAADAVASAPPGARSRFAARPVAHGARLAPL